jgi:hypothetical protein
MHGEHAMAMEWGPMRTRFNRILAVVWPFESGQKAELVRHSGEIGIIMPPPPPPPPSRPF